MNSHIESLTTLGELLDKHNSQNKMFCVQRVAMQELIDDIIALEHMELVVPDTSQEALECTISLLAGLISPFRLFDCTCWIKNIKRRFRRTVYQKRLKQTMEILALQLLVILGCNGFRENALRFLRRKSKDIFGTTIGVILIAIFGTMFLMDGFEDEIEVQSSEFDEEELGIKTAYASVVSNMLFATPTNLVLLFPSHLMPYLITL